MLTISQLLDLRIRYDDEYDVATCLPPVILILNVVVVSKYGHVLLRFQHKTACLGSTVLEFLQVLAGAPQVVQRLQLVVALEDGLAVEAGQLNLVGTDLGRPA